MFPSVTAKDQSLKDKLKERKWDQRLVGKNGIPQYSPLKDKHTMSYRKNISSSTQKQKYDSMSYKTKEFKTYFQKKVELFDKLKQLNPIYMSHLQEFEDFLTSSKIPNFYIYYSIIPLIKEVDVNGFIMKTKKTIKEQNSAYQRINTSIKARQECLIALKSKISKLKGQFTKIVEEKGALKDLIKHYRGLTANSIDQIKRWRDSLNLTDQKAIYYSDENQNYLIKMLNDNQFIFNSHLADFINFGQKNDPFIIVPLKKSQGKEASQFLDILQTEKNLAFYQKYMQYLASEKAYQLSLVSIPTVKREYKHPQIQKIYKSKSNAKFQSVRKDVDFEESSTNQLQKQKLREQRIKKNQQRINAIKSVYQSYSNKLKLKQIKKQAKKAETDVEEKVAKQKYASNNKNKKSLHSDQEFDKMVKVKIEKQKDSKLIFQANHSVRQSKSLSKMSKTEDKIIDNLKQIQTTLKNKLSFMHEQQKKQENSLKRMGSSGQKFHKKTNQNLISELKNQIIRNLQIESQQRQNQRAKRRKQQQKAIDEIKQKMKRQMEQKLQQKKKQKLIQRDELQKKLKEQEERLNRQRELQMQLQMKLAKERELRELQKLKRQSLQRQKKFKEELEKEQNLRRDRQRAVQAQRGEKQKLLQQLKKRQLKQELENQIKQQMKSKYGQNPKLYNNEQMSIIRSQKQQQLSKEIELLKLKENQEIGQIRRQNQLRQRMLKLKKEEQELKRKQVQHLMKSVIQQQKEDLHRDTIKKRIQLEDQIKNSAKQRLLEQYKTERQALLERTKFQKQKQLEEDVYREKIKQKIEKELRIQAIHKTKKEMDDRQTRKYQMNVKMETSKAKFNQALHQQFNKNLIEEEVKKQLIERVIFDKQAERQSAKNDLRAQFQRELMASSVPQIYQQNQTDPILKKNIEKYKQSDYLRNKLNQLDGVKPTNQKAFQVKQQNIAESRQYQSPKKGMSRNQSLMNSMTNEQLYIMTKKKSKVNEMRQQPSYKLPKHISSEQQKGFQLMNVQKEQKDDDFEVKIVKKSSIRKSIKEQPESQKRKSKKKQEVDSQDEENITKKKKKTAKDKKKRYESDQEDSEDQLKKSPNKKKILPIKRRDSDEAVSSQEQSRSKVKKSTKLRESQFSKIKQSNSKLKKSQIVKKNSKKQDIQGQQSPVKIYYDADFPKITQNFPEESKIQIRQTKHSAESKYEIQLEAIPEGELDEYLAAHFQQLPQIQKIIQMFHRQQLYRKLINELTFCMLLGYDKNIVVGIAFAFHDRNKTDTRKFQIVHFSTYQSDHLKDFLISCVNYIFKKDPTDQIQFHYKFDESIEEQASFSTDFNKWFDKHGNVYQKKTDDNIYQRKYVLKRQFNQKCDVVLGGINKNTFRNIFTVYCGVIMSDSDMIQFKEELRNVVTPQNQISYSIAIAELFRNYLTPDEADILKTKVKQFAKLKQLLVLVVMLQKKKVKMDELKLTQYKNIVELNMKLMSQGKEVIRYCKDGGMDLNRIYYAQLNQAFNLPFNFQTTSLPIESEQTNKVHQISYFRLSPLPPNKLHIIKSSLYNSELHILPTESSKYKLFVINAQEYNQIKESNHLDIFMYVRLFLKNVKSHNTASWKYVWLPQMTDKANYCVRQFKSFLNKDIYCHDSINISYKQFLPNALIIQPQHRDLVITPPFIVGVMSMALEQITQGSPLYARMIDVPALRTLQIQD